MDRRSTTWFLAFVCAWVVLFAPGSRAFEQKAVSIEPDHFTRLDV